MCWFVATHALKVSVSIFSIRIQFINDHYKICQKKNNNNIFKSAIIRYQQKINTCDVKWNVSKENPRIYKFDDEETSSYEYN